MRKVLLSSLFAAISLAVASPAMAEDYTVVASEETHEGHLVRTEWVVQEGSDPLNRFTVYNIKRDAPPAEHSEAVILLPPLGNNFGMYEISDTGDYKDTFAGFLAHRHIDVWGYSPRATGLPPNVCETTDCSPMADWGLSTITRDVEHIRSMITVNRPCERPAIGGFSLGGIAALAVINANPSAYEGAVIIDGLSFSTDPVVNAYNAPFCLGYEALLASGQTFDGQTNGGLFAATGLAQSAPDAPSPFIPGFTNHQTLVYFLSVHQDAPNQPHPDYVLAAGDPFADTFSFLDENRLYANVAQGFNAGFPNKEIRDVVCGLAGLDASFADNLGAFEGRALMISSGRGFGLFNGELRDQLANAEVTEVLHEGMGHVDPMLSPDHRRLVEKKVLRFLKR